MAKEMKKCVKTGHPFANMPNLCHLANPESWPPAPDDYECFALWDKYSMLGNIREHSLTVAQIATAIAQRAYSIGARLSVPSVRASALLHDLAKTWCIRHGGSHAMLGASWTLAETRNYGIAQGVILHVHWPWKLPEGSSLCCLPIIVQYADKRVKHAKCVTVSERFEDLLTRYGKTCAAREGIRESWEQTKKIEEGLSKILGMKLNEHTFNCGRMVD